MVTWYCHCLKALVHFGEQKDCELNVEKALLMILSIEMDGEEVEDERMGCAKMIRQQKRMWLLFDPYKVGLDI